MIKLKRDELMNERGLKSLPNQQHDSDQMKHRF